MCPDRTGIELAPQVGLEPTTLRLTAECSTIELLRTTVNELLPFNQTSRTAVKLLRSEHSLLKCLQASESLSFTTIVHNPIKIFSAHSKRLTSPTTLLT